MTADGQLPQSQGEAGTISNKDGKCKKKEKLIPEGLVIPKKKPRPSKAERRALQEQQRAAKASKSNAGDKISSSTYRTSVPASGTERQNQQDVKDPKHARVSIATGKVGGNSAAVTDNFAEERNTVSLFSHLPPHQDPEKVIETGPVLLPKTSSLTASTGGQGWGGAVASGCTYPLHPAVIELGKQYSRGDIRGGSARCRAMLMVFYAVIGDYHPPPQKSSLTDLRHQLDQWVLKPSFQYWTTSCRPHSVTMGNAFTFLKAAVASLERDMPRDAMVTTIQDTIEAYIRERIDLAQQAIAQQPTLQLSTSTSSTTTNAITRRSMSTDEQGRQQVFLTYGKSEVIAAIFLRMAEASDASDFRVIIVDSRPLLEGKELLLTLRAANIDCTYILLNALTYVMRDVTKVYLGASALMSDGGLLGRVGTACVALSAHMHHIPVLVCCESYKISNRVQLESITGNELGDPSQVAATGKRHNNFGDNREICATRILKDWLQMENLRLLNLLYDFTPSDFVSGIVTELGIIPPTSVAVLLREMDVLS